MNIGQGQIRFNAKTHVGRVRKINEDAILVLPDQQIYSRASRFLASYKIRQGRARSHNGAHR